MRRLRTMSSRRLYAALAAALALACTAGIAQATLTGSGPTPPPLALAQAVHDALSAPSPEGVTARIHLTNRLMPSGSVPEGMATPLVSGADGRLWLAEDGRLRLELQSRAGDAQIVSDGRRVTVYDASSNTVYRAALPAAAGRAGDRRDGADHGPALAGVERTLKRLSETWTVSGARPTSTAGQPTYTVRISPKDDGGLLGAAEVAWDAVRGAPLRAAVYAQGSTEPVLELVAEDVSYGPVADGDVAVAPPATAKVVDVGLPVGEHGGGSEHGAGKDRRGAPEATSLAAARRGLDFGLSAPDTLAGLPRRDVRLVDLGDGRGALITYGKGFGAIAVLERKAGGPGGPGLPGLPLPRINIAGATGAELATALGTVVTFERGGVAYVVAGSVPPVAAENAARGLG